MTAPLWGNWSLEKVFPNSPVLRGVIATICVALGLAIALVSTYRNWQSNSLIEDKLLQQQVRDGQAAGDFMQRIEK